MGWWIFHNIRSYICYFHEVYLLAVSIYSIKKETDASNPGLPIIHQAIRKNRESYKKPGYEVPAFIYPRKRFARTFPFQRDCPT